MNYRLIDALDYLKFEIERLEKRRKEEKGEYYKQELESVIEWEFERALEMIKFAEEHGEKIDQKTLDWFFGRRPKRPDLEKIEELMEKAESRNWLQKIWDEIRWWWLK